MLPFLSDVSFITTLITRGTICLLWQYCNSTHVPADITLTTPTAALLLISCLRRRHESAVWAAVTLCTAHQTWDPMVTLLGLMLGAVAQGQHSASVSDPGCSCAPAARGLSDRAAQRPM